MTLANDLLQTTCCRRPAADDLLQEEQWSPVLLAARMQARMQRVPQANLFPAPHIYTLSGRFDTAPLNDQLKRKVDAQRRS
jgi:hypothetical protein